MAIGVTPKRLRQLLDYDPDTGIFRWKVDGITSKGRVGAIAGAPNSNGYINIWIDGRDVKAHRLAWLWCYGEMPSWWIDHINRDRSDNRIANLRIASQSGNRANSVLNRSRGAGMKGAYFIEDRRWRSIIRVKGRNIHLGYFASEEEAHAEYARYARHYFGAFANPARGDHKERPAKMSPQDA